MVNMEKYKIELTTDPKERDKKIIEDGLHKHNMQFIPKYKYKEYYYLLKSSNKLIGGIHFSSLWDWVVIEDLWIDDSCIDKEVMSILVKEMENCGRKDNIYNAEANSCLLKYCDLLEQSNYSKFGQLENNPKNFTRSFYRKDFTRNTVENTIPGNYKLIKVPDEAELKIYNDMLEQENSILPEKNEIKLCAFIKEGDVVIGGAITEISDNWMYVDEVWIPDTLRGKGLGRKVIETVEKEAKNYKVFGSNLCTSSFQALDFYKKILGYEVFGELENYPKEHIEYYLRKVF